MAGIGISLSGHLAMYCLNDLQSPNTRKTVMLCKRSLLVDCCIVRMHSGWMRLSKVDLFMVEIAQDCAQFPRLFGAIYFQTLS